MPHNLRSTFLNLEPTLREGSPLPVDELEFREVNFEERYGVKAMTPDEIWALARRLADDEDLHEDYIIRKLGLNPDNPSELSKGYGIM